MTSAGGMLRGRHGIGAVLALITVVVAIAFDIGVTYDNGPSDFVWVVSPLLVGVGASFSARWTLIALVSSVGVHWWVAEEAIRNEGFGVDPLAGFMYAYPIVIGVLDLVAMALGAGVGCIQRRRRRALEAQSTG